MCFQAQLSAEGCAQIIGEFLIKSDISIFEFNPSREYIKIKLPSQNVPAEVLSAMKAACKDSVTNFNGVKQRIRMLSTKLLSVKLTTELKILSGCLNMTMLVTTMLERRTEDKQAIGYTIYKEVKK